MEVSSNGKWQGIVEVGEGYPIKVHSKSRLFGISVYWFSARLQTSFKN